MADTLPASRHCPDASPQGNTRAEALNNIREAIELYIEDCRDAGDPVPTEAGTRLSSSLNCSDADKHLKRGKPAPQSPGRSGPHA
jgi:hypothetical protein